VITTNQRKGNIHHASFIFYVGGHLRKNISYLLGVYSTIDAKKKVPICGRAILRNPKQINGKILPIGVRSEEYYNTDPESRRILELLTGTENNLIKTAHDINKAERHIKYGELFFAYCCYGKLSKKERIRHLRYALEHDFSDLSQLQSHLAEGGQLKILDTHINITVDDKQPDRFTVKNSHHADPWIFEGRHKPDSDE
jgi:hypothetical protein